VSASFTRSQLEDTVEDRLTFALDVTIVSAFETTTAEFSTIASTDLTLTILEVSDAAAAIAFGDPETNVAVAFAVIVADIDAVADASM